ncbi:single-stranded DNA-binding protein [Candidatus Babeliales bacterium]|nr:single-stranded DNA-binding protein [Candidatus Babeliales bacterium]MCF7899410.1 single-stranded DNA-binding protein [Candidatus Babeliales bacterium]
MASYNRVIMIGNLTRDPDYKQLSSGQAICRLSLASNRQFKNKQTGMMVQEVCFVDIDVWGAQAESCNQFLKKGSSALVEGRLKFDTWQDNEGQKRSKHSVVADRVTFLSSSSGATLDKDTDSTIEQFSQSADYENNGAAVTKPKVKKTATKSEFTGTGEVEFNDKPAFEDELPF